MNKSIYNDAEMKIIQAINNIPGVEVDTSRRRPTVRIVGTRGGAETNGVRHIQVMKRLSIGSSMMRDDLHTVSKRKSVVQDPTTVDAIRQFREELVEYLEGIRSLVNPETNADVEDPIELELKTAVQFDLVIGAKHIDHLVAAVRRLSDALRC